MRAVDASLLPEQRRVLEDIAANGVHVAVAHGVPGSCHTAGLWHTWQHPEVLVIGLDAEVGAELLELVADEIDGGRRFGAGERHDGLVHGYPVHFGAVTREQARAWLPVACWTEPDVAVPCLQLVYPDKQGRWPWDASVREGFAAVQPVLERLPGAPT